MATPEFHNPSIVRRLIARLGVDEFGTCVEPLGLFGADPGGTGPADAFGTAPRPPRRLPDYKELRQLQEDYYARHAGGSRGTSADGARRTGVHFVRATAPDSPAPRLPARGP